MVLDVHKPDLAFLDVRLGSFTSFDLLNSLPVISFGIIFTTSYEEYALQAFRSSAIDYLLKPVDRHELSVALRKFSEGRQAYDYAAMYETCLPTLAPEHPRRLKWRCRR